VIAALGRLIDEERIDIVHAQGWGTFLEGLVAAKYFAKRRPAFIYVFQGKTMENARRECRFGAGSLSALPTALPMPASLRRGPYGRRICPDGGPALRRIDLIHNSIDVHRFSRESRAALGLGTDDFVVGFGATRSGQGHSGRRGNLRALSKGARAR
jgi:hypothetical protein